MFARLAATRGRITTTAALVAALGLAVLWTAAAPASASAATKTKQQPVLAEGAGMGTEPSSAVRSVQRVLDRRGYELGRPGVDGRFGPLTVRAVRRFQAHYGLMADGIVGPKTQRIVRLVKRRAPTSSSGRTTPAPQTNTPSAAVPQLQPQATVLHPQDDHLPWLLAVALSAALGAALVALAARWRQRYRHALPILAPITRELYLEGHSGDVGEFRGHALATTIDAPPGEEPVPQETSYLVDDVRKAAPVWVSGADVRRATSRLAPGAPVIGYVTMSPQAGPTDVDMPAREIEKACQRSQWDLLEVVTDRENGVGALDRPGLSYALDQIADGKARGLVVSDLRRLGKSVVDIGALMEWFRDSPAALVGLDLGVDTSTASGREIAAKLIRVSGWERERVARRSLVSVGAPAPSNAEPGRRLSVADRPALVERINAMRADNMTLQAIADELNAEGVPTLRGGVLWRPSSVQTALGYRRPGSRVARTTEEDRRM
jgi:peptidoglycan hydrolase-like protein with peptidoglycan-binding domain/DNA invertase Pin-like site-specific DNA recombinase